MLLTDVAVAIIFRVQTAEHSGHANEVVVTAEVYATGPSSSAVGEESHCLRARSLFLA